MNRNTEWFTFRGKVGRCRVQDADLDFKTWWLELFMTPASIELFKQLKEKDGEVEGILNELKSNQDGEYAFFRRPMFKNFGHGDEPLLPPVVLDAEGRPLPADAVRIGSGSDVSVKVECYKFNKRMGKGKARAIRLVAVQVHNLVPLKREDYSPRQQMMAEGLDGAQ